MDKVCIVGFGCIGPNHANALLKTENAVLYAICDPDETVRERAEKEYGVKTYSDFETVLQDSEITSVHICTPHYLHFPMIKRALAAGKKVVAEKPITRTREEFDQLLNLGDAEQICAVFQNRYNPCVVALKKAIDNGELGKILGVKGILTWFRDSAYYEAGGWRGRYDTEGGSVAINQAVHTLDLMIHFAGSVRDIQGDTFNFTLQDTIEMEDTAVAHLDFESGARGTFFATNGYAENSPYFLEVVGEKGKARYQDGKLLLNGEQVLDENSNATAMGKSYWGSGHEMLIRRFYDNGEKISIYDVENTMKTLFALYESAKNGATKITIS